MWLWKMPRWQRWPLSLPRPRQRQAPHGHSGPAMQARHRAKSPSRLASRASKASSRSWERGPKRILNEQTRWSSRARQQRSLLSSRLGRMNRAKASRPLLGSRPPKATNESVHSRWTLMMRRRSARARPRLMQQQSQLLLKHRPPLPRLCRQTSYSHHSMVLTSSRKTRQSSNRLPSFYLGRSSPRQSTCIWPRNHPRSRRQWQSVFTVSSQRTTFGP